MSADHIASYTHDAVWPCTRLEKYAAGKMYATSWWWLEYFLDEKASSFVPIKDGLLRAVWHHDDRCHDP